MNFRDFYFDIDFKFKIDRAFTIKENDTDSRGFNVKVNNTDRTMTFYTKDIEVQGVKITGGFRIDLPPLTAGVKDCEIALKGINGEKLSSKTFKIIVLEVLNV